MLRARSALGLVVIVLFAPGLGCGGGEDTPDPNLDAGSPMAASEAGVASEVDADVGREPDLVHTTADSAAPPAPGPDAATAAAVASLIETVGMDVQYKYAGVAPVPVPAPVVLLRDGTACRTVAILAPDVDLQAHRAMYPGAWTHWKRLDGRVALQNGEQWKYLYYRTEYPPLPSGSKLQGVFTFTNTTFLVAGSSIAQNSFAFGMDGRFASGAVGFVFVENDAVNESAGSTTLAPDRRGTYEIDGYRITLRYDSGQTALASFIFNPADPSVLWLDGRGYVVGG